MAVRVQACLFNDVSLGQDRYKDLDVSSSTIDDRDYVRLSTNGGDDSSGVSIYTDNDSKGSDDDLSGNSGRNNYGDNSSGDNGSSDDDSSDNNDDDQEGGGNGGSDYNEEDREEDDGGYMAARLKAESLQARLEARHQRNLMTQVIGYDLNLASKNIEEYTLA